MHESKCSTRHPELMCLTSIIDVEFLTLKKKKTNFQDFPLTCFYVRFSNAKLDEINLLRTACEQL